MKSVPSTLTAVAVLTVLLAGTMVFLLPVEATSDTSSSSEWHVSVTGFVNNPLNVSLSELQSMPQTSENATIYCVDFPPTGAIGDSQTQWTGVKLSFLLQQASIQPEGMKIAFFAADGYSTDLSFSRAMQDDVLLAYSSNGAPLSEVLRLVVPGNWGYKWISQVTRIEIVNYNYLGVWENKGYSDVGTIVAGTPQKPPAVPIPSSEPTFSQATNPTSSNSASPPAPSPSPTIENPATSSPEPTSPLSTLAPTMTQTLPPSPSSSPISTLVPQANAYNNTAAFPTLQLATALVALAFVGAVGVLLVKLRKRGRPTA